MGEDDVTEASICLKAIHLEVYIYMGFVIIQGDYWDILPGNAFI